MTSRGDSASGNAGAGGGAPAAGAVEVDARIVYWGVGGAGKTTSVRGIYARLRADHRGRLREVPTRIDPTQTYDVLPIELGLVQGVRTRLHIVTVPGGPEHAPTRKQLLDRVDGVVFVIDAQRERIDENVSALEELRSALAAYGRALEEVPLVLVYNKRDLTDPYALEELHRKLAVAGAAAFEGVATEGTGVLQALTTISKRVIRARRESPLASAAPAPAVAPVAAPPAPAPRAPGPLPVAAPAAAPPPPVAARLAAPPAPARPFADAPPTEVFPPRAPEAEEIAHTAARAERVLDASWQEITGRLHAEAVAEAELAVEADALDDGDGLPEPSRSLAPAPAVVAEGALAIASVGEASRIGPRSVRLPLVLHDEAGREHALTLTVSLDPLLVPPHHGET